MTFKIDTEYHVVELNGPPPFEIIDWVKSNFGDGQDGRWAAGFNKFFFANKHDHLMFVLKWSNKNIDS